jgi:hypothetical protein
VASLDVKDYGAVGDGIADDTAAIQACLDANNYAYLPSGTYRIGTIYVNRGGVVRGNGGFSTTIKPISTATGSLFSIKGDYVKFESFYIFGEGKNIHAFTDYDPARTDWYFRYHFKDIISYNVGGNTFNLTGRGLDYLWEGCFIDNSQGYGLYARNISDSLISHSQFGSCVKAGVSVDGGNIRIVGSKIYMNGRGGYAGLEVSNTLGMNLAGCEIQQNVYDGVLLTNVLSSSFMGVLVDSNNQNDLTGSYAQIRLINSKFNKFDITLVDGRFATADYPYNTPGLNGITQDSNSCYNRYEVNYYPYELAFSNKAKHVITPFASSVNDITSVFRVNNSDYFDYPVKKALVGTDITLGTGGAIGKSPNFTITPNVVNGGKQVDLTQTVASTLASDFYSNRTSLNMANFTGDNSPTGKSFVYLAYDAKVLDTLNTGLNCYIDIYESSTANPTPIKTGQVRVINVNKNSVWVPMATYKPLSYSNEAGFQVYLTLQVSNSTSAQVNASDIIASFKNFRIGFY